VGASAALCFVRRAAGEGIWGLRRARLSVKQGDGPLVPVGTTNRYERPFVPVGGTNRY
jgi:hypothetical protein